MAMRAGFMGWEHRESPSTTMRERPSAQAAHLAREPLMCRTTCISSITGPSRRPPLPARNKALATCIIVPNRPAGAISTGGGANGNSAYFENNGTITAIASSTTATNTAQAFTCWFGIPVVWKNTGTISAQNSSPNGFSETFYYGAQNMPMSIFNSGTISASGPNNTSTAFWMENDGDTGDMHIYNSGTITNTGNGFAIMLGGWGPPGNIHVWYTNSGTVSGGMLAINFPATVWESGQVHTTVYGVVGYNGLFFVFLCRLRS